MLLFVSVCFICYISYTVCINIFFLIFKGIDLSVSVPVPVYTFACTYFYCLVYIACPMSV